MNAPSLVIRRSTFPTLFVTICIVALASRCIPVDRYHWSAADLFPNKRVLSLVQAAEAGDVPTIKRLVAEGVDVNSSGRAGVTPLFRAVVASNKVGFETLLELGADPNQRDDWGDATIHACAEMNDGWWVEKAIQYGADPNRTNDGHPFVPGETPIFYSCRSEAEKAAKALIDAGADVDHRDKIGATPLEIASEYAEYDIAYMLLKAGANFRNVRENGVDYVGWFYRNRPIDAAPDEQKPWLKKVMDFLSDHGMDLGDTSPVAERRKAKSP